jgi:predicted phosphodiesterase
MARFRQEGRIAWVEGPGDLIVVSDLHGNLRDFLRAVQIFESRSDACLLFLGDLYHGPYLSPTDWAPHVDKLGDFYYDQSPGLFRAYLHLKSKYPNRVRAILGNHEHAHIGGPRVAKFTPDEAASFESSLTYAERVKLARDIEEWPWIVASECGVAFTHGSPPPTAFDQNKLNNESPVVQNPQVWAQPGNALLSELLWRRFSPPHDVNTFLGHLNNMSEHAQSVVTYGHEPSPEGYQVQHATLFNLSTSFAMKRNKKVYLSLALESRYETSFDVEEQIIPLYPDVVRTIDPLDVFDDFDDTLDEA